MIKTKLFFKIGLFSLIALLFWQCETSEIRETNDDLEAINVQNVDPEILRFLRNMAVANDGSKSLYDPEVFEVGIRVKGLGIFREMDNVHGCLLANIDYELIFTIPVSGPNNKPCACVDFHRIGISQPVPTRLCKDTSIVSEGGRNYKFVTYTFKTTNMGQVDFTAISGCSAVGFSVRKNYMRRICNMYDL